MVQFRRLDPLANASPYQRHVKRPVKSFSLSEAAYNRLEQRRPELIVLEGESAVVGRPHRDFLEVYYAFPDVPAFRRGFNDLFERCTGASSKEEAPRGVVIPFRDRPNRALAEQLFWDAALEEAGQWVELDWPAVPEQPEPEDALGGYTVREATAGDRDAIAALEAEVTGLPRLTPAGLDSIYEDAEWLRLITTASGVPVGYLSLRREPGGWGIVDQLYLLPAVRKELMRSVYEWSVAFLRNHGGRRLRRRAYLDDGDEVVLLRELGFQPAETGVDYTRPVDRNEVRQKVEERQAHGTLIKFGDWR